jgi:hypothetical protein
VQRTLVSTLFSVLVLLIAGCGGGGGSGGTSPSSTTSTPTPTPTPPPVQNSQLITVDGGPANGTNGLFTTVTICSPTNASNCQTIDHVLVDTGSSGLRIISSVLAASLAASLPQQTDASGRSIVECLQFVDGYSWGPVKTATIKITGESTGAVPIHVIGDPEFSNAVPSACSSSGPSENTVNDFGANGILGVSAFVQDCGSGCAQNAAPGFYYACSGATCQATTMTVDQQVSNPVAMFVSDNNGVVISLPSVPSAGALSVSGTMVFGIGTQSNNALGTAKIFLTDPITGNFTTQFNNQSYSGSFIDSGSNGLYFQDGAIPTCSNGFFYCPASTESLSAINVASGANGAQTTIKFSVANADMLFANNPTYSVFALLAGPNSDSTSFDWGLPFFYGRTVYTLIEGKSVSGSVGPFVAY